MAREAAPPPLPGAANWGVLLYNLALVALLPVLILYVAWRVTLRGKVSGGLRDRLGRPRVTPPGRGRKRVWVHAVSVGEVMGGRPIIEALRSELPGASIVLSTITPTGQAVARKSCAALTEAIFYFPFDFLPCVALSLRLVRPDLVVLFEGELWPNFLALCRARRIPTCVVNGRISDTGWRRARPLRWLYRSAVPQLSWCAMQSALDAERIVTWGADPRRVAVYGNTKFDQDLRRLSDAEREALGRELGVARDDLLIVAGSTHPGEEEQVLDAFRLLRERHPKARLLIAPRHINRADEIVALVARSGFACARRTAGPDPSADVILLDTMGELARAYALGAAAFVGGSLVPFGGHDVLQAIAQGSPVFFGPHMHNFRDIADLVARSGVGFVIHDASELARGMLRFIEDPGARQRLADLSGEIIRANQGASRRSVEMAAALLRGALPEG
jgi:3-deoxy-D-manno-octulosonic-acid transferase